MHETLKNRTYLGKKNCFLIFWVPVFLCPKACAHQREKQPPGLAVLTLYFKSNGEVFLSKVSYILLQLYIKQSKPEATFSLIATSITVAMQLYTIRRNFNNTFLLTSYSCKQNLFLMLLSLIDCIYITSKLLNNHFLDQVYNIYLLIWDSRIFSLMENAIFILANKGKHCGHKIFDKFEDMIE